MSAPMRAAGMTSERGSRACSRPGLRAIHQALRASVEEIDRLSAANDRMSKRIQKMMAEIEDNESRAAPASSWLGSILASGSDEAGKCVAACGSRLR